MLDSLYIAATGMQAQQLSVDTIANNLANVNTAGFKKARVSFTDLLSSAAAQVQPGETADGATGPLSGAPPLGSGVGVASVAKLFDLGDLQQTGSAFDVAIRGDGFLQVVLPDGSPAYTRGGTLTVNAEGMLATASGMVLEPGITIPQDATALTIGADGRVLIAVPGQGAPVEAGVLELVRFTNPGALTAMGDGVYRATEASGEPLPGKAGEDGVGPLTQGYLEGSNVKMVDEMVSLMVAQRAYEASVKVVQASDEILGLVNNLRK